MQGNLERLACADTSESRGSVIKVTSSRESRDLLKVAISMIVSDCGRGCKWLMDNLKKSFIMRRGFKLENVGHPMSSLDDKG